MALPPLPTITVAGSTFPTFTFNVGSGEVTQWILDNIGSAFWQRLLGSRLTAHDVAITSNREFVADLYDWTVRRNIEGSAVFNPSSLASLAGLTSQLFRLEK